MEALPYIQLYVADYLADTMHLNAEQHGAYLLLIMNYWQTGKPLPNDDLRLANIAKIEERKWKKIKSALIDYFVSEGDLLVHTRIDADLNYINAKQEQAVKAGKASALASSRVARKNRG